MQEGTGDTEDIVIAIEGIIMHGTGETSFGEKAIHIVSAWCNKTMLSIRKFHIYS